MKTVTLECKLTYRSNGQIQAEVYLLGGKLHNPNGVALKYWYENGQIETEQYWIDGKRHNQNGVAYKYWYENGKIYSEGYWIDGKYHNPNGIAYKSWYDNGQIQSEDYYINGVKLTKEEFDNIKPKPCNNKTVEVDGVKYKLTAI